MNDETTKALVADDNGIRVCAGGDAEGAMYADGDVEVRVAYSGINYKDALAVTGKGKILRASPMIPGIDYAGEVTASRADEFKVGDSVALTGFAVGEKYSGGFATRARGRADWLVPLADGMSARQAMACGTAGLTAALCVMAVTESGYVKDGGSVVVSGASGGVGSFAVMLLARMGYAVSAVSRDDAKPYLAELGAAEVLSRGEMAADAKPLEKSRWDGAVDTVGGKVLARIVAEMNYGGVVAACGLAGGHKLETTVMPFILRGIRLDGVDSVMIPKAKRLRAWALLAKHLRGDDYDRIVADTVGLDGVASACDKVLGGDFNGRILVDPRA